MLTLVDLNAQMFKTKASTLCIASEQIVPIILRFVLCLRIELFETLAVVVVVHVVVNVVAEADAKIILLLNAIVYVFDA